MPCVAFAGLSVPPLARERALHPPAILLPASLSACLSMHACACIRLCLWVPRTSFVGSMLAVEERVLERAFGNNGRLMVRRVMVPPHRVSASESSSAGACICLCRGDDRQVMKLRADLSGSGGSTVGTDSLGEGVLFNRGYAHEGSIEALWDDHHNDGHGSFGCEDGGLDDGSEEVPLDVIKGGGGGGLECRRQQLLRYFGERSKAGGTRGVSDRCCDVCYNPGLCFCGVCGNVDPVCRGRVRKLCSLFAY